MSMCQALTPLLSLSLDCTVSLASIILFSFSLVCCKVFSFLWSHDMITLGTCCTCQKLSKASLDVLFYLKKVAFFNSILICTINFQTFLGFFYRILVVLRLVVCKRCQILLNSPFSLSGFWAFEGTLNLLLPSCTPLSLLRASLKECLVSGFVLFLLNNLLSWKSFHLGWFWCLIWCSLGFWLLGSGFVHNFYVAWCPVFGLWINYTTIISSKAFLIWILSIPFLSLLKLMRCWNLLCWQISFGFKL